jgi:mitogen-activated protein kinase organizer 1
VRDVAVSADNSKFASAGGDRQLFLWDVATGQTIRKFAGHDGVINSVRPVAEQQSAAGGT